MKRTHLITVSRRRAAHATDEETAAVKRAIRTALELEGADMPCAVSVIITTAEEVRELNREMRGVDKETDVLSFPSLNITPEDKVSEAVSDDDIEDGRAYLGDVAICRSAALLQAEEFGHSELREISYLSAHSALHLLGYDHIDPEDERVMRREADRVMDALGLTVGSGEGENV